MSKLHRGDRDYLWLRLIVLTFIGAGINVGVVAFQYADFLRKIPSEEIAQTPLITPPLLGTYLGFSLTYCFLASTVFVPRRLVSPLWTHGIGIFVILVLTANWVGAIDFDSKSSNFKQNLANGEITLFVTLTSLAAVQHFFLKWLLGTDGDPASVDRRSYTANIEFEELRQLLVSRDVIDTYSLVVRESSDSRLVLSRSGSKPVKAVIVLMVNPSFKTESLISTAAYEIRFNEITNTRKARLWISGVMGALKEEVESSIEGVKIVKKERLDGISSEVALTRVVETTRSQFETFRQAPRTNLVIIVLIALFGIGMTLAMFFAKLEPITYSLAMLSLLSLFLFEVIPRVRERISSRS